MIITFKKNNKREEKSTDSAQLLEIQAIIPNGEIINTVVTFSEFKKTYENLEKQEEATFEVYPANETPDIEVETFKSPKEDINVERLERILNFLKENKIDIEEYINLENDEILIRADFDEILHLPWERKFEKEINYIREVIVGEEFNGEGDGKNLMMLYSHGCIDTSGADLGNIHNDFSDEATCILKALWEEKSAQQKPVLLQVVKHLTKEVLANMVLDGFHILHFMMHGEKETGNLGFETLADHTKVEWYIKKEFVEKLKEKSSHGYLLICLASCYSAYGEYSDSSLTFMVVQNGVSKYSIGFNGGMGSQKSLPTFAKTFYTHLFQNSDIEGAFFRAVSKLKADKSEYWHKPYLYKAVTL